MTLAERLERTRARRLQRHLRRQPRARRRRRRDRRPSAAPRAGPWPPGTPTAASTCPAAPPSPAPPTPSPPSAPWPRWPRPTGRRSWSCATSTATWARPRWPRRSTPGSPPAGASAPSSSILAPLVQLPPELEAQFVVVEHEPPGRDQLEAIARGVATEPGELPDGRRPGGRPRRGGGAGPRRGRGGLRPVAGPPRPAPAGAALGDQGRHAQEVGPAGPAPRRRLVRRPGRPRGAQVVLLARPAAGPAGRRAGPRRAPARAARLGQVAVRQGCAFNG